MKRTFRNDSNDESPNDQTAEKKQKTKPDNDDENDSSQVPVASYENADTVTNPVENASNIPSPNTSNELKTNESNKNGNDDNTAEQKYNESNLTASQKQCVAHLADPPFNSQASYIGDDWKFALVLDNKEVADISKTEGLILSLWNLHYENNRLFFCRERICKYPCTHDDNRVYFDFNETKALLVVTYYFCADCKDLNIMAQLHEKIYYESTIKFVELFGTHISLKDFAFFTENAVCVKLRETSISRFDDSPAPIDLVVANLETASTETVIIDFGEGDSTTYVPPDNMQQFVDFVASRQLLILKLRNLPDSFDIETFYKLLKAKCPYYTSLELHFKATTNTETLDAVIQDILTTDRKNEKFGTLPILSYPGISEDVALLLLENCNFNTKTDDEI